MARQQGAAARTIVVLTKVDLSVANPARLQRRLADHLKTVGFVSRAMIPVINRQDEESTLLDTLSREKEKFAEFEKQSSDLNVTAEGMGLMAVLTELNLLIETHMYTHWVPQQKIEAAEQLKASRNDRLSWEHHLMLSHRK